MKPIHLSIRAASAAAKVFVKTTLLFGVFVVFAPGFVLGDPIEKKGTAPYVTHFVFRPLTSIDVPGRRDRHRA
jgi:hypothetical protein